MKYAGKASVKGGATDWKRLRSASDKAIRIGLDADPDVRPTDIDFWKSAKVVLPRTKQTVTILTFFGHGPGNFANPFIPRPLRRPIPSSPRVPMNMCVPMWEWGNLAWSAACAKEGRTGMRPQLGNLLRSLPQDVPFRGGPVLSECGRSSARTTSSWRS
jgi:hypothetical protein